MYMNLLQFYVYGVFVRRTSGHGVWLLDCVDRGQRPVSVSGSPWTETEAREPSKENTPATNSSRRSKSSDQTKLRERERDRERERELARGRQATGTGTVDSCSSTAQSGPVSAVITHDVNQPRPGGRTLPGSSYSTQSKHVLGGTSDDSLLVG